jgi:predicted metal-dependent HD superfamily phosphohydrolase
MGSVGSFLLDRYGEPTRVYHDVRHLVEVLGHVDMLGGDCADATVVELAAWFHDAVYDVRRDDNEVASARLARTVLSNHVPDEQLDEVQRLVLLTHGHAVSAGDSNGAVLCDADLAILASGPTEYADYTSRVRREYGHVSDAEFRIGRAAILKSLLDLPQLFHTTYAVEHWEAVARTNLTTELCHLAPP